MHRGAVDAHVTSADNAGFAAVELEGKDAFEDATVAERECAVRGRGDVWGEVDNMDKGAVGGHETGLCKEGYSRVLGWTANLRATEEERGSDACKKEIGEARKDGYPRRFPRTT